MKRILKWTVPVNDRVHEIGGGPILHIACQDDYTHVQVWTEELVEEPVPKVKAYVVGTGHGYPDNAHARGTVLAAPGLVWHLVVLL